MEDNKKEYFMPMCYMYRNAVELGLKRIIVESSHIERAKALKVLQKKIVNQKAKQDDRVTKTIQEYQEKKAYYENHPLVVNYLYLQNEVNEILQTINQQMNNALK